MKTIFSDFTMQFELVRTMGHAPFGGADIKIILARGGKSRPAFILSNLRLRSSS